MVQTWRALHESLLKIALHHRCFSKNFTSSAEQQYRKINPDGCFRGQLFFENFPEWLLLKDSCKDAFILQVTHILHFLLWRHVKVEQIFMDFFFGRGFRKKCKYSEISLNITQKQYFSSKSLFSFHYSWIATPWISKKLFFKFSFFKGTLRP